MKKRKNYRLILVALVIVHFTSIPVFADIADDYFKTKRFNNITLNLVPQDHEHEKLIKSLSDQNSFVNGQLVVYENTLFNKLLNKAGANNKEQNFYSFLFEKGYITFQEYKLQYERLNVPKVTYIFIDKSFHKYSNNLIKFTVKGDTGDLMLFLAERKLKKINYKNQRTEKPFGVTIPIISVTFNYTIVSRIPGIPSPNKTYEGKAQFGKNLDTGKWEIINQELNDGGVNEIFNVTPKSETEMAEYYRNRQDSVLKEFYQSRSQIAYEKGKKYELTFKNDRKTNRLSIYIGVLTNDDVVIVENVDGSPINSISLMLRSNLEPDILGFSTIIGKHSDLVGYGPIISKKQTAAGYFDIAEEYIGTNIDYPTLTRVTPHNASVIIDSNIDKNIKVTITCVENYDVVTKYGLLIPGGKPENKNQFKCSERFKSLKEVKLQ